MTKGFKKDGKFRPTEKRNKSSLKKKDVLPNVDKQIDKDMERNLAMGKTEMLNMMERNPPTGGTQKTGSTAPKDLERNKRSLDEHQKHELQQGLNGSDIYNAFVEKFPNSSVGADYHRWKNGGYLGNHGHFGDALKRGDIEEAMYRADGDNLVNLGELHIENFLSNVRKHPDDPSPREEFLSRLEWAKNRDKR